MSASPVRINARLDAELARKVAAVQRRTKKSLTEIVKESLTMYCDDRLSRGDALKALEATGFVGCAQGAPDLSERYKEALQTSLGKKS